MKNLLPLWLIIFISFFCYSSMLTMFVPLLQDSHSSMYNDLYSLKELNILSGILLALYPLGQFLGSPMIGAASDRFGRKNMLCTSLILSGTCLLLCGYAILIKSLYLLMITCFIAGFGESNMALALSAIADLTSIETRGSAFARAWAMCSIGYITGSIFGGVASLLGYSIPFIFEAILIFLILVITYIAFKDTKQVLPKRKLTVIILNFMSIFKPTNLRSYYLANFLAYIACFGVLRVELIYMQSYFHLSQVEIAIFYSYASIIAMIANFLVTPILIKRTTIANIVIMSGILAVLSSIIFIIPTHKVYLWITTGLIGFCIPIMVAMVGALISTQASANEQGAVMGNNQSLQVIAEAISAAIGGIMFAFHAIIPFVLFAAINLIAVYFFKRLQWKQFQLSV